MTTLEVPWKHRDESKKSRVKTHEAHQGPALSYEVLPSEGMSWFQSTCITTNNCT